MSAEGARLNLSRISQAKGQRQTKSLPPHFFVCLYSFFQSHRVHRWLCFLQKEKRKKGKGKRKNGKVSGILT
jgi:hypothetical protein